MHLENLKIQGLQLNQRTSNNETAATQRRKVGGEGSGVRITYMYIMVHLLSGFKCEFAV